MNGVVPLALETRNVAGDGPRGNHRKIEGVYPWGAQWPPPKGAGNFAGEECRGAPGLPRTYNFIDGYRDGFVFTSPVAPSIRIRLDFTISAAIYGNGATTGWTQTTAVGCCAADRGAITWLPVCWRPSAAMICRKIAALFMASRGIGTGGRHGKSKRSA